MTEQARKHSRFAPSSSRRWINCPGSLNATKYFKDQTNEAAMEGTAAHSVYEACMLKGQNAADYAGYMLKVVEGATSKQFEVDEQMQEGVQDMLDYCRRIIAGEPGDTHVEAKVDLTHIEPEFYGHADFAHVSAAARVLSVVDFKYGRINVDASGNEQAFCYAEGCLNTPNVCPDPSAIDWVRIAIVQPRSTSPGPVVDEIVVPVQEVRNFGMQLKGAVEATKSPMAPLKVGDWCKYCPALGVCPATSDRLSVIGHMMTIDLETATNEQISMLFNTKKLMEQVMKKVDDEAKRRLMARQNLPDTKLVTSVTHRKWTDEEQAKQQLFAKYGMDALQPVTPAQAEKLGDKGKEVAQLLAKSPPGGPVAAHVGDKRKPYTVRSAAEIFG